MLIKSKLLFSLGVLFSVLLSASSKDESDIFLGEDHKAGLIPMKDGDDMFYWLFKSRSNPDKDPLVMWLTGGPGCGSEVALFFENGPFNINEDLTLKKNPYSWNSVANVIFIDQPIGTGFSKCSSIFHYETSEE